jgi:hypothetical protein
MISLFMTIPLLIHGQTEATWLTRQFVPSFMVALAGEFYKLTKDMTESPVFLPVHLCVGEGAEHRVQTGARRLGRAMKRDEAARHQQAQMEDLCARYKSLTPRQRDVRTVARALDLSFIICYLSFERASGESEEVYQDTGFLPRSRHLHA